MRFALCLLILCLTLALPAHAAADDVVVSVQVISASKGTAHIDAVVQPLQGELLSGFPDYNVFRLVASHELTASKGKQVALRLPDNDASELLVTFLGSQADTKMLRLEIGLRGKLAAKVDARPGSSFFQAGLAYKDGILILSIKASPV